MNEIDMLRDTFEPELPSAAAEQRARAALRSRMNSAPVRSRVRSRRPWGRLLTVGGGAVMAAAVVAAFAISRTDPAAPGAPVVVPGSPAAAAPYLRPVSAAQYLENAAWSAEQEKWTDPTPQQFMYVETLEMRNQPPYERQHPNGALLPGKAAYRDIKKWDRIDGQVQGTLKNGKLVVEKQGDNGGVWAALDWATISGLTTPAKVRAWVADPGPVGMDIDALVGQYVLPPEVKAAMFRYLADEPGMTLNPDAVNLDGRPAIGLGRIEEGYLSQELLFDKQTYALVGERLIAIKAHTTHGSDEDMVSHKGDLYRQVIYRKMAIVDEAGEV
jgi:hypothetical protein